MVNIAKSIDTSESLGGLEAEYRKRGRALPINFREIVPWIPYNSPRYTHLLHSYPAKVIPHIPHFFLSAKALAKPDSIVLDPFSGSGTVALEACLAGLDAVASDSNPLARLLTKVKTSPISPRRLDQGIRNLKQLVAVSRSVTVPEVVNLEYWFTPQAIKQLARISAAIKRIKEPDLRALAQIAFSSCVRKSSLTDPRISVPVRLNPERYDLGNELRVEALRHLQRIRELDVPALFFSTLEDYANQVRTLWEHRTRFGRVDDIYHDSLDRGGYSLARRSAESVDMIITSPPYLGAQKYIRASSLSLNWLELASASQLREVEDLSIGREHFRKASCAEPLLYGDPSADRLIAEVHQQNPLRARIAAKYLHEMREVLEISHRLLRRNGSLILVSGCNSLCGRPFNTTRFLMNTCRTIGFKVRLELSDTIKSRGLMTRRNHTAGLIPTESVVLFSK